MYCEQRGWSAVFVGEGGHGNQNGLDWTGLMVVVGVVVVVVDFCQMGGLVTGGTVDGEMTNSGSTRQNGVSLTSGKVPLEKTLGLRSAWRG